MCYFSNGRVSFISTGMPPLDPQLVAVLTEAANVVSRLQIPPAVEQKELERIIFKELEANGTPAEIIKIMLSIFMKVLIKGVEHSYRYIKGSYIFLYYRCWSPSSLSRLMKMDLMLLLLGAIATEFIMSRPQILNHEIMKEGVFVSVVLLHCCSTFFQYLKQKI